MDVADAADVFPSSFARSSALVDGRGETSQCCVHRPSSTPGGSTVTASGGARAAGAKPLDGSGSSASVEDVDGFAGNADHVAAKRRREAAEHDLSALRTCTSAARGLSVPARAACSARTSARRYTHSATSAVAHAETTRNEMPGRPVLPAGTWGSARVVASPA